MKLRPEFNILPKTVVVKLSSLAVTHDIGGIDKKKIKNIAKDIKSLVDLGIKPIIVSSGAVNAGKPLLKMSPSKHTQMSYLQACSCIGQPILMSEFQVALKKYDLVCAQQLVTHEDFKNKKRSYNVQSSLQALVSSGIIPIINENDGVSFDEITVGDNDQLSALIAELLGAQALLLLTKARGVFDKDPSLDEAQLIPLIHFNTRLGHIETKSKTLVGRGGMRTKILAARKLTPLGIAVIVSTYGMKEPIMSAIGKSIGTFFEADTQQYKKESWILPRIKLDTGIFIDEGAFGALKKNASLLPVGIIKVVGRFSRGESIPIYYKKEIIAYGVVEYSSKEIEKIKGLKTRDIGNAIKYMVSKVVIHKNHLVMKRD